MERPIIGILPSIDGDRIQLTKNYLSALFDAGALGVVLEPTTDVDRIKEYCEICDGFLLSGGVDIDPSYYGEEIKFENVKVDKSRDDFESLAVPMFFETKKPMLGVCRGLQGLNVFLGGNLYQHIDGHIQTESGENVTHEVNVVKGSLLYNITNEEKLNVNTFHHQNIKDISEKFDIDAYSYDGYIEAIHAKDHPFCLGVQWHPEIYRRTDEAMRKVFSTFVLKCKETK